MVFLGRGDGGCGGGEDWGEVKKFPLFRRRVLVFLSLLILLLDPADSSGCSPVLDLLGLGGSMTAETNILFFRFDGVSGCAVSDASSMGSSLSLSTRSSSFVCASRSAKIPVFLPPLRRRSREGEEVSSSQRRELVLEGEFLDRNGREGDENEESGMEGLARP